VRLLILQRLLHFGRQHRDGNTARNFASVVAAHAIRQHGQAKFGVGRNAVFIMRPHHTRISGGGNLECSR